MDRHKHTHFDSCGVTPLPPVNPMIHPHCHHEGRVGAITIKRDEVEYSIDFISWKVANVRVADAEQKAEAQTDGESNEWILEQIEDAVGNVEQKLAAYITNVKTNYASDELKDNVCEWVMLMRMEEGWMGSMDRLARLIHKYIVNYAVANWFKIVMPSEYSVYMMEAEQAMTKIVENARTVKCVNVKWTL